MVKTQSAIFSQKLRSCSVLLVVNHSVVCPCWIATYGGKSANFCQPGSRNKLTQLTKCYSTVHTLHIHLFYFCFLLLVINFASIKT